VTLVLNTEVDISRGDLIVAADRPASVVKDLTAALVWMDQRPLELNRRYLLKHTSQTAPVLITALEYRTDIGTLRHDPSETLEMNGIGAAQLSLLRPIALDRYAEDRATGAFILIDPESNSTVAAGMVTAVGDSAASGAGLGGPVTAEERAARWGHRGAVVELKGSGALIDAIERALFARGAATLRVDADAADGLIQCAAVESGLIALRVSRDEGTTLTASAGGRHVEVHGKDSDEAVRAVYELLEAAGIFSAAGKTGEL
jgi:sulfate adenylyltransferase subunit 1